MYITKEKTDKVLGDLNISKDSNFSVYVDMKFFLKDICNPYHTSTLRYMSTIELHQYFIELHNILSNVFGKPVYFVYSFDKIAIDGIPGYKSIYYSKYFDDPERDELLGPIKKVYDTMKHSSIVSGEYKFIDSSAPNISEKDEFGFIKSHHGDKKALVITRDKIFNGYDDVITVDPYELSIGEIKIKQIPEYYKIVLAISGYEEYSLPGIPGIKEKTVDKIIKKIVDSGEYIYYNTSSISQPLFPISYETLNKVSDITREEYEMILANWKFLN